MEKNSSVEPVGCSSHGVPSGPTDSSTTGGASRLMIGFGSSRATLAASADLSTTLGLVWPRSSPSLWVLSFSFCGSFSLDPVADMMRIEIELRNPAKVPGDELRNPSLALGGSACARSGVFGGSVVNSSSPSSSSVALPLSLSLSTSFSCCSAEPVRVPGSGRVSPSFLGALLSGPASTTSSAACSFSSSSLSSDSIEASLLVAL
mmetsp:Transcript_4161/g.16181  ORF Transcript_4161/g.16181 Transcript_4161/m.16181 type:complete len:205 (-) Transcript_4161:1586-2200(-)